MRKKWFCALLLLTAWLFVLGTGAQAAEVIASGKCGDYGSNVTYKLDSEGMLTIQGTGRMDSFHYSYPAPWGEIQRQHQKGGHFFRCDGDRSVCL